MTLGNDPLCQRAGRGSGFLGICAEKRECRSVSVLVQIVLGSTVLVFCLLIHLGIQVWVARKLRSHKDKFDRPSGRTVFITCSAVVIVLLFSHTMHLYI